MKLLEGKTALITGGARGIGRAIVLTFAQNGANVAFSDLKYDEQAQEVEKEAEKLGVKCKGFASDASNFEDAQSLIKEVTGEFERIDILINNAGIARDNLFMRMTEDNWDDVIRVNLKSAFNMTHAVQRLMLKQRGGSIINMSSVVGLGGNAGQANYAASKAGLVGFSKSIAQELGSRNIRCNVIAPGFIQTEMTDKLPDDVKKRWAEMIPLKKPGKPEDVANMAAFLGSDLSEYVTGQVITVCGGMHN